METPYKILKTYTRNNKVTVDCLCICGNAFTTPKTRLDRGRRLYCNKGSCDYNVRKLIGQEIGPYRILSWDNRHKKYKCLCKFCSSETLVRGPQIKINVKCGNCQRFGPQEKKRRVKCAVLSTHYKRYIREAERRDLSFDLSEEEFESLVLKNCAYCNAEPFKRRSPRKGETDKNYSGLDRINNLQGYAIENCVPCCINCNVSKSDLDLAAWFQLIKRIYEHFDLKEEGSYEEYRKKLNSTIGLI